MLNLTNKQQHKQKVGDGNKKGYAVEAKELG